MANNHAIQSNIRTFNDVLIFKWQLNAGFDWFHLGEMVIQFTGFIQHRKSFDRNVANCARLPDEIIRNHGVTAGVLRKNCRYSETAFATVYVYLKNKIKSSNLFFFFLFSSAPCFSLSSHFNCFASSRIGCVPLLMRLKILLCSTRKILHFMSHLKLLEILFKIFSNNRDFQFTFL